MAASQASHSDSHDHGRNHSHGDSHNHSHSRSRTYDDGHKHSRSDCHGHSIKNMIISIATFVVNVRAMVKFRVTTMTISVAIV
eukprot:1047299-Lingulodinium_polyedra.AAC.1